MRDRIRYRGGGHRHGSPYGLAGVVNGTDLQLAHDVARRLRIGYVVINGPPFDPAAPWGWYKASGNGREWGPEGVAEYLETKAIIIGAPA